MKDNISLVIASIVAVIVLVLLPLLSIFLRQDNISYNVAYTLVENFVDDVRYKGFFTKDEYQTLSKKLAATGSTYVIEFEVHQKELISDAQKTGYVEDTFVYYNQDVIALFEETDSKEIKPYTLNEGDEIYLHVYSNSLTKGTLLFNYFTNGISNKKAVDITYGGKVYRSTISDEVSTVTPQIVGLPSITIGVPKNRDGNTPTKNYLIWFDIGEVVNKTIMFDVTMTNIEYLYINATATNLFNSQGEPNQNVILNAVKEHMLIPAMLYGEVDIINVSGNSPQSLSFTIQLTGVNLLEGVSSALNTLTLQQGMGGNSVINNSPAVTSEQFWVVREAKKNILTGPYLSATSNNTQKEIDYTVDAYFKVKVPNAKNITTDTDFDRIVGGNFSGPATNSYVKTIEYVDDSYSVTDKTFWIKVTHRETSANVNQYIQTNYKWDGANAEVLKSYQYDEITMGYTLIPPKLELATDIKGPYASASETGGVLKEVYAANAAYFKVEYTSATSLGSNIQSLISEKLERHQEGMMTNVTVVNNTPKYDNSTHKGYFWLEVTHNQTSTSNDVKDNYIKLVNNWNNGMDGNRLPEKSSNYYDIVFKKTVIYGPFNETKTLAQARTATALTSMKYTQNAYFYVEIMGGGSITRVNLRNNIAANYKNASAKNTVTVSTITGGYSVVITHNKLSATTEDNGFNINLNGIAPANSKKYTLVAEKINIYGPYKDENCETGEVDSIFAGNYAYFKIIVNEYGKNNLTDNELINELQDTIYYTPNNIGLNTSGIRITGKNNDTFEAIIKVGSDASKISAEATCQLLLKDNWGPNNLMPSSASSTWTMLVPRFAFVSADHVEEKDLAQLVESKIVPMYGNDGNINGYIWQNNYQYSISYDIKLTNCVGQFAFKRGLVRIGISYYNDNDEQKDVVAYSGAQGKYDVQKGILSLTVNFSIVYYDKNHFGTPKTLNIYMEEGWGGDEIQKIEIMDINIPTTIVGSL